MRRSRSNPIGVESTLSTGAPPTGSGALTDGAPTAGAGAPPTVAPPTRAEVPTAEANPPRRGSAANGGRMTNAKVMAVATAVGTAVATVGAPALCHVAKYIRPDLLPWAEREQFERADAKVKELEVTVASLQSAMFAMKSAANETAKASKSTSLLATLESVELGENWANLRPNLRVEFSNPGNGEPISWCSPEDGEVFPVSVPTGELIAVRFFLDGHPGDTIRIPLAWVQTRQTVRVTRTPYQAGNPAFQPPLSDAPYFIQEMNGRLNFKLRIETVK